jgi:hypothetical protein
MFSEPERLLMLRNFLVPEAFVPRFFIYQPILS